ncbi:transposase [Ferrimonas sp. SCSIO 43195]|uniref:transposase n=1 Tax=Ferrimonas sp. SCSIO 43195 TaxID=2822844 RepID=UPI002074B95D|nr:transposase [Ferrimonas sp. SCSIO 43195]USD39420.1 transposase [Ferrimonas sp. SCSIO 43195]
MPTARKQLVSLQDTPYYHCVSRCVRRSFLCGTDVYTGISYEHRRHWVEKRLLELSQAFAIDICAFAVMTNHTHVVLHVDAEKANAWSTLEVLTRWHCLFGGTELTRRYCDDQQRDDLTRVELHLIESKAELYRNRLADLSWYMRSLNEFIAREANKEDQCTGRFWEGRFKSQALLDEQALLACMAYVDLNPIRSGMAKTPEQSDFTSIQMRIRAALQGTQPERLKPFDAKQLGLHTLPCHLNDYLELVEFTGRVIRADKAAAIPASSDTLLQRLGIDLDNWMELTQGFEYQFCHLAGRLHSLQHCHQTNGMHRIRGSGNAKRLLGA